MTVFFDINAALNSNLSSMAGLPAVAWPNQSFEPAVGTMYIRPTFLPAESVVGTIGDGTDFNSGIYQIDVFTPASDNTNESMLMLDLLADQFKRDKDIVYNSRIITVRSVSHRNVGNVGGWYHQSLDVIYYSYTSKR